LNLFQDFEFYRLRFYLDKAIKMHDKSIVIVKWKSNSIALSGTAKTLLVDRHVISPPYVQCFSHFNFQLVESLPRDAYCAVQPPEASQNLSQDIQIIRQRNPQLLHFVDYFCCSNFLRFGFY